MTTSPNAPAPGALPVPSIAQLFDLTGHVAVVTGAALGIGQAIAFRLAQAGAACLVADVNLDAAQATVRRIEAAGGRGKAVRADASSVSDARMVAQQAVESFGRLDILVNNAGIFPITPALQISEQQWDRVLDVNLKGAFFYSQAAAERMIAVGSGGRIVNIASIDALHPTGFLAHYDASKGGMLMLTRALAKEFAQHGITVNAVAPGGVQTPGATAAQAAIGAAAASAATPTGQAGQTNAGAGGTATSESADFTARIPLGRTGQPDDIAKVVLFLVSHAADYMTGALLVVDGGFLLS